VKQKKSFTNPPRLRIEGGESSHGKEKSKEAGKEKSCEEKETLVSLLIR
jgi:hypothetical protein